MNTLPRGRLVAAVGVLVVGPFVTYAVVALDRMAGGAAAAARPRPHLGRGGPPGGACRRCGARCARCAAGPRRGGGARARCRRCRSRWRARRSPSRWRAVSAGASPRSAVGWSVVLVPVLALVTGLVAMSAVDLVVMRIPTRFVYVTALRVLAGAALVAVLEGPARRLAGAGVGASGPGRLPARPAPRLAAGARVRRRAPRGARRGGAGGVRGAPTIPCSCRCRGCQRRARRRAGRVDRRPRAARGAAPRPPVPLRARPRLRRAVVTLATAAGPV